MALLPVFLIIIPPNILSSYNRGHNNWNFYRVYVIKVKTTSNRKSIYSRRKIETLGLPFDIGLRTLDLSIWWSVWPIHVICALLVPDITCNACIKGLFEIDIISIDMQYFVTRNILYFTLFYAVIPIYFVRDCLWKHKTPIFSEMGHKMKIWH